MLLFYHLRRKLLGDKNENTNEPSAARQLVQSRSRPRRRSRAEYNRRAIRLLQSTSTESTTSEESFITTRGDNSSNLESEYEIESFKPAIIPTDTRKPVYRPGVIKPTATMNMLASTFTPSTHSINITNDSQPSTSGLQSKPSINRRNIQSCNLFKLVSTPTVSSKSSSNKINDNSSNSNTPDHIYRTIGVNLGKSSTNENTEVPDIYRKFMTYELNTSSKTFKATFMSEVIISQQVIDKEPEQSINEVFEEQNHESPSQQHKVEEVYFEEHVYNNIEGQATEKGNFKHETHHTKEKHQALNTTKGLKLNKIKVRDQILHSKHKSEMQRSKQKTKKRNLLQKKTRIRRKQNNHNPVQVERQLQTESSGDEARVQIKTWTGVDRYSQTLDPLQNVDEQLQTDNSSNKVDNSTDTESCELEKKILLVSQSTSSSRVVQTVPTEDYQALKLPLALNNTGTQLSKKEFMNVSISTMLSNCLWSDNVLSFLPKTFSALPPTSTSRVKENKNILITKNTTISLKNSTNHSKYESFNRSLTSTNNNKRIQEQTLNKSRTSAKEEESKIKKRIQDQLLNKSQTLAKKEESKNNKYIQGQSLNKFQTPNKEEESKITNCIQDPSLNKFQASNKEEESKITNYIQDQSLNISQTSAKEEESKIKKRIQDQLLNKFQTSAKEQESNNKKRVQDQSLNKYQTSAKEEESKIKKRIQDQLLNKSQTSAKEEESKIKKCIQDQLLNKSQTSAKEEESKIRKCIQDQSLNKFQASAKEEESYINKRIQEQLLKISQILAKEEESNNNKRIQDQSLNKPQTSTKEEDNKTKKNAEEHGIVHAFQSTSDTKKPKSPKSPSRISRNTNQYDFFLNNNTNNQEEVRSQNKEGMMLPIRNYVLDATKKVTNNLTSNLLPEKDINVITKLKMLNIPTTPCKKLDGPVKVGVKPYIVNDAELIPCECKKCICEQKTLNECKPTKEEKSCNLLDTYKQVEMNHSQNKPKNSLLLSEELSQYSTDKVSMNSYKSIWENRGSLYFDLEVHYPSRCEINNELEKKEKHTSLINASILDHSLSSEELAESYIGKPLSRTKKIPNLVADVNCKTKSLLFKNNENNEL